MDAVGGPAGAQTPVSASAKKASKFKPRTGNTTTLGTLSLSFLVLVGSNPPPASSVSASSAFPSFKTSGFKLKPQATQEVIVIPDSPSTSSSSLKRNSSDPSLVTDPSPQAPKRPKRDAMFNKENLAQPTRALKDAKGKGKCTEMEIDGELCHERRGPFLEKGRATPLPSVPAKPASSTPHTSTRTNAVSDIDDPEQLRSRMAHCESLNYQVMNDTLTHLTDPSKDIEALKYIKAYLDERIQNYKQLLQRASVNKVPAIPTREATPEPQEHDVPFIDMTAEEPQASGSNSKSFDDDDDEMYWNAYDDDDIIMDPAQTAPDPPPAAPTTQSTATLASQSPVPSNSNLKKSPHYPICQRVLKDVFGLEDFRTNQLEAVIANMDGRDVFVLMPTGGGKSLCYQLPAVCVSQTKRQTTIVVTPLLALMEDQVKQLKQRFGVNAIAWNSDSTVNERDILAGKHPIIYVTPEKLSCNGHTKTILQRLDRQGLLARFVIDEAHCISTWGQDFREAYANLGELRVNFPSVPIIALTATANKTTIQDIILQLKLQNTVSLVQSFNRPNLRYTVKEKKAKLIDIIAADLQGQFRNESGVIYCRAKKTCETISEQLQKRGIRATFYHAGLGAEERARAAADWMQNRVSVVVATIAFGMGIDKADVRYVIHYDMPKNMSGYYQETGRAGRDGLPAECILYYNYGDFRNSKQMIDRDEATSNESKHRQTLALEEMYAYCRNCSKCRRSEILRHFDETFDKSQCNQTCDVCQNPTPLLANNSTNIARSILKLMKGAAKANLSLAAGQITSALKGSQAQDAKRFQDLPGYGEAKNEDKDLIELVVNDLLFDQVLDNQTVGNNGGWHTTYITLGPKASAFERKLDHKPFITEWRPKKATGKLSSRTASGSGTASTSKPAAAKGKKKGRGHEIPDDPIEEDMYEPSDDDAAPPPKTKRPAPAPAPAPVVVSVPSISAPVPARTASRGTPVPRVRTPAPVQEPLTTEQLHTRLLQVRERLMNSKNLASPQDVLDDQAIEMLTLMPPSDYIGFKRILADTMVDQFETATPAQDAAEYAERKWKLFGQDFLSICIGATTGSKPPEKPVSKTFQPSAYEYRPPTAAAAPPPMNTTPIPRVLPGPSLSAAGPSRPAGTKKKFQPK